MVHVIICEPVDFPQELDKYCEELPFRVYKIDILAVCRLEKGVAHYLRFHANPF